MKLLDLYQRRCRSTVCAALFLLCAIVTVCAMLLFGCSVWFTLSCLALLCAGFVSFALCELGGLCVPSWALWTLGSVCLAFGAALLYSAVAAALLGGWFVQAVLLRAVLLLPVALLVGAFLVFSVKDVCEILFRYRWAIAGGLFVLLVACKVNLSNVSYYHTFLQNESATPYTLPLFGIWRGIRSDEWLVDLPRRLAAEFSDYGKINSIVRGTDNYSISCSYLYLSYSALWNPFQIGFYLFGSQYGLSFNWCGLFLASFMLSFEMSYILCGKRRLYALVGAVLIGLSSFSLWWSICTYLISVQAVLVGMYWFLHTEKRWQRALLAAGIGWAGAFYVCALYPAWQVPLGYIALAVIVWMVISCWKQIRAMKWQDWAMVAGALAFMASIVLAYLRDSAAYMEAVMHTVYPGERFSCGGFWLHKAMWYLQSPLYPFLAHPNPCEASTFFCLFPLPTILACWTLGRQLLRRRHDRTQRIDVLTLCLLVPTLLLLCYCSVGLPTPLTKLTFMGYSIGERAVDFLGLLQVYLLFSLLATPKEDRLPWYVGAPLSVLSAVGTLLACVGSPFGAYMPWLYAIPAAIGTACVGYAFLSPMKNGIKNALMLALCAVVGVSSLCILPWSRGTDALTEKPVSYAIREIVAQDPDAKWCGVGGITPGQILIANGAPCVTSINYIPNMELYQKLDPEGTYNEVYNRYHHISCCLTAEPTSFALAGPDHIIWNLNYADLKTAQVSYLFSLSPVEEQSDVIDLSLRYAEGNCYIYDVIYLD